MADGASKETGGVLTSFLASADEIDKVFSVSRLLQRHFIKSLDEAAKNPGITHTQTQRIQGAKKALEGVRSSSISAAEKDIVEVLYRFAIVTIVSIAEQLLKSTFNGLIAANLDKIEKPEKFTITLRDLKAVNFNADETFWADHVLSDLYGVKNPQEKLNFQNMRAIESLFKDYLDIDMSRAENYDEIAKDVHKFFQVRHILAHNGGYIDSRFIRNLEAADIPTKIYQQDKMLILGADDYRECTEAFVALFELIEAFVQEKGYRVADYD